MRKLTLLLSALLLTSFNGWADENDAIVFKDAAVEKICVDNWDTNGDGKLSYAEAAAVTTLNQKFKNNQEIVTFNEFQYFTGVKNLKSDFLNVKSLTEITMPSSMEEIGETSFYGCSVLTSVVLNEGLQKIGVSAFEDCKKLESVTLPESLTELYDEAFYGCTKLKRIEIPSKVKKVYPYTFSNCTSLEEVILGDGVEEIDHYAFRDCRSLTSFNIPKNVNHIYSPAFSGCVGLKNFTVDFENVNFTAPDGNLYSMDMKTLVAYALGRSDAEYKIEDGVETVCVSAFSMCEHLVRVVFPESTDSIGDYVFEKCVNLESVVLPKGLKKISNNAFSLCSSLKNLNIPVQLSEIGDNAFSFCTSLKRITLPESLVKIGAFSFIACDNLKDVYVYSKTGDIEGLDNSQLINQDSGVTVYVPEGCVDVYKAHSYWGNAAEIKEIPAPEVITFKDAKVEAICVANWDTDGDGKLSKDEAAAVTSLDDKFAYDEEIVSFNEFQYFTGVKKLKYDFCCAPSLTEITMPSSMEVIGNYSFEDCAELTSVVLNEGLQKIGDSGFANCEKLESITLPESLTEFDQYCFSHCFNLKGITIPSKVKIIPYSAFCYCPSLKEATLGDGVEEIEALAFAQCDSLANFNITKNVNLIKDKAFAGCPELKNFTVDAENVNLTAPDGNIYSKDMKKFVAYAPGRTDAVYKIKDGVETVCGGAFEASDKIIKVVLPESTDSIGNGVFERCGNLESVVLPKGLKKINASMFAYCFSLKNVNIPAQLSEIGESAFTSCGSLKTISLPESLVKIGDYAFIGCDNLMDVYVYSKTGDIEGLDKSKLVSFGSGVTVYVPEGCVDVYKNHKYWSDAKEIKEIPAPEVIAFEDAKVEAICVANWDADGDGKLNVDEAAAVTSLEGKFAYNKDIKSFNEFKYFTGVNETAENEFAGSSLVSITMPESMRVLGNESFIYCEDLKNVVLNDGLERICQYCFMSTAIDSIDVPDNVNRIDSAAFQSCHNLKSFKMPAKCNVVSFAMLCDCHSLDSLTLHDNVTSIGDAALNYLPIKTFHIGKKLQSIGVPFIGCNLLEEFTIDPENQWFAFKHNALYSKDGKTLYKYLIGSKASEYTVPDGVEVLGSSAFEASRLAKISLPESLITVDGCVFMDCYRLKSIDLPEGVTELGNAVFAHCDSLKTVTYSSKMQKFGFEAFRYCKMLEKIVLPETLTSLGNKSFEGCDNLKEIVSYSKTGEFDWLESTCLIPEGDNMRVVYVPAGCKSVYEANAYWANAHEIIEMQPTDIDGVNGTETITINGVKVAVNGCADIYSIEGVLVKHICADDRNINLPAGVYVINGKKIVVR